MRLGLGTYLLAASLAVGCGGDDASMDGSGDGSAGDDGDTVGDTGGVDGCIEETSEVARDEQTPLGFSADDLLAAAGGPVETDLAWAPNSDVGYSTHTRAETVTTLGLALAYEGGTIQLTESSEAGPCQSQGAPCPVCESRIDIPVRFSLTTGDGALDETLDATITATMPTYFPLEAHGHIDDLVGDYVDGVTLEPPWEATGDFMVTADYSDGTWSGQLSMIIKTETSLDVFAGLGQWPAADAPWNQGG